MVWKGYFSNTQPLLDATPDLDYCKLTALSRVKVEDYLHDWLRLGGAFVKPRITTEFELHINRILFVEGDIKFLECASDWEVVNGLLVVYQGNTKIETSYLVPSAEILDLFHDMINLPYYLFGLLQSLRRRFGYEDQVILRIAARRVDRIANRYMKTQRAFFEAAGYPIPDCLAMDSSTNRGSAWEEGGR